ncbi:MAG: alanyl-tRNA editing protein [Rhizobiaceae bacterium]|nr:alanyl-tRNA editing protein [Rhizobiaceae bacterium]
MSAQTELIFREDAYRKEDEARVVAVDERGILLDRTIFYGTSGGQPGDTGKLLRGDGAAIDIVSTVTGHTKDEIVHVPAPGGSLPEIGERLQLAIDWPRRYKLMKMHTACHLLSVIYPYPITGASVSEDDSRVDFDFSEGEYSKEDATARLMEMVEANHPVFTRWITEDELAANPGLVKSKNVRPPSGTGRIRLVCIGENAAVDSQPCGGTHVASTGEIGQIHIGKIEKKGRENRRFRIRFGSPPA